MILQKKKPKKGNFYREREKEGERDGKGKSRKAMKENK